MSVTSSSRADGGEESMVKVIRYGQKRRITCNYCGALLEFEEDDLKTIQTGINEYERMIECPACNESVKVD